MADAPAPPDRLARILDYKKEEVAALRQRVGEAQLATEAGAADPPRPFAAALHQAAEAGAALICEIKRRSPSAGDIAREADAAALARAYSRGGAACLSVLTDGPSFGGALQDLREVRAASPLPCLRKDFMIDPLQVLEARAGLADAVLVIIAALDDACAEEIEAAAMAHGMAVLVEVHDEAELERGLRLRSPFIGVNNRNLRTFTTDLAVTERLARLTPGDRFLISESGVREPEDVARLSRVGARGFLIGEALMRSADPAARVAEFRLAGADAKHPT